MKKRIMGVLLAAICAIGLIGCGNTNNSDTSAKKEDTTKASYIVRIGMPTAGKHFQNFTRKQLKKQQMVILSLKFTQAASLEQQHR